MTCTLLTIQPQVLMGPHGPASSPSHPLLPSLHRLPSLTGLLLTGSQAHQTCLPQSLAVLSSWSSQIIPSPHLGLVSAHAPLIRETFSPLFPLSRSCSHLLPMILLSLEESPIANVSMCLLVSPLEGGLGAWVPACSPSTVSYGVWKSRGSTHQVNEREDSPAQEGRIQEGRPRARAPPCCPTAQCQAW